MGNPASSCALVNPVFLRRFDMESPWLQGTRSRSSQQRGFSGGVEDLYLTDRGMRCPLSHCGRGCLRAGRDALCASLESFLPVLSRDPAFRISPSTPPPTASFSSHGHHVAEGCKDGAPFWIACGCHRPEKWDAHNASLPALEQRGRTGHFGNQFRQTL